MPFDYQSAALGMIVGSFLILLIPGSSLTQSFCNPHPVDRAEKNRFNEAAKFARTSYGRYHGE